VSDPLVAAALAGLIAGLGVAMPLGAIGVLILRESMLGGLRRGASAAAGVAFVDLAYCALAIGLGAVAAPLIRSWGVVPGVISGVVLIVLGVRQLAAARRPGAASPGIPTRAVFVRFVGLTAINPVTLLYFFALAGALAAATEGPAASAVFVVAAGLASLVWQLGLAVAGKLLGATVPEGVSRLFAVLASGLVLTLGVGVIVGTLIQAS
jgi:threonine/homoserine/homoserine lactone efflux protein